MSDQPSPDQIAADFQRDCELRLLQRRVPLPQKKESQTTAPAQMPTQAAPHSPEKSQEQRFQEELAELVKTESRRHQIERDKAAGLARLQQYADEQNLLETPENAALVQKWLDEKVKGYWSAGGVDAAVANLRGQLKWRPKVAPTPPPSKPKPELLPNGEPRLPLGTVPSHRYSVTQLRDLDEREREQR
jgi:hypothetical protein